MIIAHFRSSFRETFPPRAGEWALTTMLVLWGVILWFNPTVFTSGPSFAPLARIVSQETWSVLCLLAGGGRFVVLMINGAWRRSPHARSVGAFVSCFFWYSISVGFLNSGTFSTGLAVYPVLLIFDAYNAVRAGGEAARSDATYQRVAGRGSDS